MNIYIPFLFSVLLLVSCSNNVQQDTATPAKTITSNDKQAPSNVTNPATSMPVDGSKTQTANATTDSLTINKTDEALQPNHERQHRIIDLMTVTKFSKKGVLIGGDVNEYFIKGEVKQKMSVKLESMSKDIRFAVIRPDGQHLVSDKTEWDGELRGKGKYSIWVDLNEAAAKAGKVVTYKLIFSVDRKPMELPTREDVLQGRTHPEIVKPKGKDKK